MEEEFILFKKLKEKPVRDCLDLSRNMIGKRNGFVYFTESFRKDFENKMYKCAKMQEELDKKDEIINKAIERVEYIRQYFSEDCQADFVQILEILKDKKVIDW